MAFVGFENFAPSTPEQKERARRILLERSKAAQQARQVQQAEKKILQAQKQAEKKAQQAAKKAEKAARKAYQQSLKQALKVLPPSPEPYVAPGEVKPIYEIVQPGKKIKKKKIAEPQIQYVYESVSIPEIPQAQNLMEAGVVSIPKEEITPTEQLQTIMAKIPIWGWIALAGVAVFFLFGGKGIKGKGKRNV